MTKITKKRDDAFMRWFFYLLFIVSVFFGGCLRGKIKEPSFPKPVFPDKELKEIFIYGNYYPENKEEKDQTLRKESFDYSGIHYCYNETEEYKKQPIFKDNLRVRLYSKEGELLAEDHLRIYGSIDLSSQTVSSYLPYHAEGYTFRVVRLNGKKEISLWETKVFDRFYLKERSGVLDGPIRRSGGGWVFDENKECHRVPGPE